MKKLLYLTTLSLIFLLFVTSCDKQKNKEIETPDDNITNVDDKAEEDSNELHILFYGPEERKIIDEKLSKTYNDIFDRLLLVTESDDNIFYGELYETAPEIIISQKNKELGYCFFDDHPHRNYEGRKDVLYTVLKNAGDGERGYLILDSSELYNEIEEFIENIRNCK